MNKQKSIKLINQIINSSDFDFVSEQIEALELAIKYLKGTKTKATNGKASKNKGKVGERELANKLKEYGYDCRRGEQYCGANGDADVVGLEGIHIECKRVEKLNLYDAISQAKADAKGEQLPTVFHRKNDCEWLVSMPLEHWIKLYREWDGRCEKEEKEPTNK